VIDSIRVRLTAWYVALLAAVLAAVTVGIYVLLSGALYARIDENLRSTINIATTSLTHDIAEGQSRRDAAESTAAELFSGDQTLVIFDGDGRLLASRVVDDELDVVLPPLTTVPDAYIRFDTVTERDDDDRHRFALRRVSIPPDGVAYIVAAGGSLENLDEELASLRGILIYVLPVALTIAAIGGWFLARQGLMPVVAMADRARRMGVENLTGLLPVANPRDELGRLALTFNELLTRLNTAFVTQRQFMADASHELRTPIATAHTAAGVTLQQPKRTETEYREALAIIDQEMTRLTRLVEDMFVLARADAGSYPVRSEPFYLDETIDEAVTTARILARRKNVSIELTPEAPGPFIGDEDLIRRMVLNVLENGVRYAPPGSAVTVSLRAQSGRYAIEIADRGSGIPVDAQPHVFERFYRSDRARSRPGEDHTTGAGLGLAIARWIARVHAGDLVLVRSDAHGTVFNITLPHTSAARDSLS
jgi:heavy metal sensor kinase